MSFLIMYNVLQLVVEFVGETSIDEGLLRPHAESFLIECIFEMLELHHVRIYPIGCDRKLLTVKAYCRMAGSMLGAVTGDGDMP